MRLLPYFLFLQSMIFRRDHRREYRDSWVVWVTRFHVCGALPRQGQWSSKSFTLSVRAATTFLWHFMAYISRIEPAWRRLGLLEETIQSPNIDDVSITFARPESTCRTSAPHPDQYIETTHLFILTNHTHSPNLSFHILIFYFIDRN
jgi:hypothetical protein